jgi:hypothetical protein
MAQDPNTCIPAAEQKILNKKFEKFIERVNNHKELDVKGKQNIFKSLMELENTKRTNNN